MNTTNTKNHSFLATVGYLCTRIIPFRIAEHAGRILGLNSEIKELKLYGHTAAIHAKVEQLEGEKLKQMAGIALKVALLAGVALSVYLLLLETPRLGIELAFASREYTLHFVPKAAALVATGIPLLASTVFDFICE